MNSFAHPYRLTTLLLLLIFSPYPWAIEKPIPTLVPGETPEARLNFLHQLDDFDPLRQFYFELATRDPDWRLREDGAYNISGDLSRIVPKLLKLITADPNESVRLSAALNLSCKFNCNGVEYRTSDVRVLEHDMPLLHAAIQEETGGRYIVEILDSVWCEMTAKSRASLATVLGSALPHGKDTVSINDLAKYVLKKHSEEPCRHP
jgi:hypothetical protein